MDLGSSSSPSPDETEKNGLKERSMVKHIYKNALTDAYLWKPFSANSLVTKRKLFLLHHSSRAAGSNWFLLRTLYLQKIMEDSNSSQEELPRVVVGVLVLQGSFIEHQRKLEQVSKLLSKLIKLEVMTVKEPKSVDRLDGLIIPGGESTTMGLFLKNAQFGLVLKQWIKEKPGVVWGTCAGLILLANRVEGQKEGGQPLVSRTSKGWSPPMVMYYRPRPGSRRGQEVKALWKQWSRGQRPLQWMVKWSSPSQAVKFFDLYLIMSVYGKIILQLLPSV